MSVVHVDSVGVTGPGLASWPEALQVLCGVHPYEASEVTRANPALLPANERRRVSATVKLALKVAEEAMRHASVSMDRACSVFATRDGDTEIIDKICAALLLPERPVSPTQFHNSVHNAAAGYWAIAAHSPMPSTTISAYHASFAAGLMEAVAQLAVESRPVLLVAYDYPAPVPLAGPVGVYPPFAVAMLLSPQATPQSTRLRIETVSREPIRPMDCAALETLRLGNPAAGALPILHALARGGSTRVVLPHVNGLQVAVSFP